MSLFLLVRTVDLTILV